jgi:hypothetical protein
MSCIRLPMNNLKYYLVTFSNAPLIWHSWDQCLKMHCPPMWGESIKS